MDNTAYDNGLLTFHNTNAKIANRIVYTLSLPAAYSCPGALHCKSWCDPNTGKIHDGPKNQWRCSAAGEECRPSVRRSRWRNYRLLRAAGAVEGMAALILQSLPQKAMAVRPNAAGDFFNLAYLDAFINVAKARPRMVFYAYSKSLDLVVQRLDVIPPNLIITASRGGKWDLLIEKHGLKSARVVFSPEEAARLGLLIDHDDSLARRSDIKECALLLHGVQPKGSAAAAAISEMNKLGIQYSYPRTGGHDGSGGGQPMITVPDHIRSKLAGIRFSDCCCGANDTHQGKAL